MKKKVKLIYLTCIGRSGSTLSSLILGDIEGVQNVGEIDNLEHVFTDENKQHLCGCGELIKECNYWDTLFKKLKANVGFNRSAVTYNQTDTGPFGNANHALLEEILKKTGNSVIFDKSMQFHRLKKLLKSPDFEILILHQIRDGRAVANSWRNFSKRNNRGFDRLRFVSASIKWMLKNLSIYLMFHKNENYIQLRYEDFVEEDKNYMNAIIDKIKDRFSLTAATGDFKNLTNHFVGGNRMRFSGENRVIKKDQKYLDEVSFFEWYLCSIIQYPVLKKFNYQFNKIKKDSR